MVKLSGEFMATCIVHVCYSHSRGYQHRNMSNEDGMKPFQSEEGVVNVGSVEVIIEVWHLLSYQVTQHILAVKRNKR